MDILKDKISNFDCRVINMKFKNNNSFFNTNTKEDLEKAKELIKNND